jgi:hypothetical protein
VELGATMSDFSDSPKWKLVNNFTIHENRSLRDGRPFMLTCVPKTLHIEVTSFEIVRFIEWPSLPNGPRPDAYVDKSYAKFTGEFRHKIVVFSMAEGEVATFRRLTDATIQALPVGKIGGRNKATVFDGIGFSGMTSRDVPEAGLMEGEPGTIIYFPSTSHEDRSAESLTASLFLDEDKFVALLSAASNNQQPLKSAKLCILAELFESEVSASLSEPWMSCDYGLLMKGSMAASTRARIESISLSSEIVPPKNP